MQDSSALFFAVQAKGDDIRDVAYWENVRITYTPVPVPTSPATPAPTTQVIQTSTTTVVTTTVVTEPTTEATARPTSSPTSHEASSDLPWPAIGVVVAAVISSITSIYVAARSKR
jgi:hypothetical protein